MQWVLAAVVCLILADIAPGASADLSLSAGRITPGLDPVADKTFFKKDYPADTRPSVADHFDHPFPTVQDSGDFAKDFVKDDNGDGGEWKAQEAYDRLRMKVSEEKGELQSAIGAERKKEADLRSAQEEESAAEAAAKEAETTAVTAGDAHGQAQGEADKAKQRVADGTAAVEAEITDLEDCQKQLKDAKDKLAALEAAATQASADRAAAVSSAQSARETAVEKQVAAEQQKAASESEEAAAAETESAVEKTVAQETTEHDAALKSYESEMEEAARTKTELEEARKRLRKFRKDVDDDGGVYRSASTGTSCPLLLLTLVAVGMARVLFHD